MTTNTPARKPPSYDIDREVLERYGGAADRPEPELCCPSLEYDRSLLDAIPDEVLAVDFGCGDPSRHARPGESVLDLGSGSGKACFMISQRVGPSGKVVGVDMNAKMLALARRNAPEVARRVGFENVRFVKGHIQDLGLDLEALEDWLSAHPVTTAEGVAALEAECVRIRRNRPLIADESIDLVVSNCVLNLVRPEQKAKLFTEIHRVLERGGRAVISDIVCDEDPTQAILDDPTLWSGCIAGAFREDRFPQAFEEAGLYGVEVLARSERPWRVVDGIEFRSMTVRAFKGKEGACLERNQAVVFRGPWSAVRDDDGHEYPRGARIAVCDKTFNILTNPDGPYAGAFVPVPPRLGVPLESATPFACRGTSVRDPRVTKGSEYRLTATNDGTACTGPECC